MEWHLEEVFRRQIPIVKISGRSELGDCCITLTNSGLSLKCNLTVHCHSFGQMLRHSSHFWHIIQSNIKNIYKKFPLNTKQSWAFLHNMLSIGEGHVQADKRQKSVSRYQTKEVWSKSAHQHIESSKILSFFAHFTIPTSLFSGDLQVWQTLIQYQSLIDLQLMNRPSSWQNSSRTKRLRSRDGWAVEKAFESNLSRDWIENILWIKLWTEVAYKI